MSWSNACTQSVDLIFGQPEYLTDAGCIDWVDMSKTYLSRHHRGCEGLDGQVHTAKFRSLGLARGFDVMR